MANSISKIKTPSNDIYNLSVPYIVGTGSTAGTWLGALDGLTAYYDGLLILYKPSVAGASTTTLNINSLGAKTCYINNTTKLTTHFPANQPVLLVYSTSQNSGCWMCIDDYWTNSNTIGEYIGSCTAGPGTANMARYSLIMQTQLEPARFASLVTTSDTATTKTKQTIGFIPNGKVFYQSADTYAAGSTASQTEVWSIASVNLRYSFNITTTTFAAAGASVYIKGTINSSDGLFYLADTWWANTLPNTADGFYYIQIGQLQSRYQCTIAPVHPIYYHNGTKIVEYSPSSGQRPIQVNGTQILGNDTTALNLKSGNEIDITASGGDVTIDTKVNAKVENTTLEISRSTYSGTTTVTQNRVDTTSTNGYLLISGSDAAGTATEETRKTGQLSQKYDDKVVSSAGGQESIKEAEGQIDTSLLNSDGLLITKASENDATDIITKMETETTMWQSGGQTWPSLGLSFTTENPVNNLINTTIIGSESISIREQDSITYYPTTYLTLSSEKIELFDQNTSKMARMVANELSIPGKITCEKMSVQTETSASFTKTAGVQTFSKASYTRSGNVIQLKVYLKGNSASASVGTTVFTGNSSSALPLPESTIRLVGYYSSTIFIGSLYSTGELQVRLLGTALSLSSSNELMLDARYIAND